MTTTNTPPQSTTFTLSQNRRLVAIPAFRDNYIWLLADISMRAFWLIDPGDVSALKRTLPSLITTSDGKETLPLKHWSLKGVLITHHHHDHTGGIEWLIKHYPSFPIIGPQHSKIPWVTQTVEDAEPISILDQECQVLSVPGHTLEHMAYFLPGDQPLLFCGDTLFAAGCGRLFEGSHAEMRHSLQKIRRLPQNTLVCCAHEYTQSNLQFALAVSPHNSHIKTRYENVIALRKRELCTLPSQLGQELLTNPFLRWDSQEIICSAINHQKNDTLQQNQPERSTSPKKQLTQKQDADWVFSVIRSWKNNF